MWHDEGVIRGGRLRGALWSGAAITAVACVVGVMPASAASVPTKVDLIGYGYDLDLRTANGQIESPRAACVANRKATLLAKADSRFEPFARDVSSDNGFFGGDGTQADGPPTKLKVVVRRKRLSPSRTCARASDAVTVPTGPGARPRTTFPTAVGIFGAGIGDTVFAVGRVTARQACRKNRRIAIVALRDEGDMTVDADRASDNGYFGGGGPAPSSEGVRAVAAQKPLGGGDRCAAASAQVVP